MSKDPYEVLGIDRNASDDEIKRAYKELARKYHPDKYNNNPLAELAEEKMREINEAYDTLMKGDRKANGNNSGYGNTGYGGSSYGGSYGQGPFGQGGAYGGAGYGNSDANIFMQVRACINNGNIAYADSLLSRVNSRNAEWYFLKGVVFMRQGRVTEGAEYINRAAQMNPSNQEYARMAQQVNSSGFDYRQTSVNSGYGTSSDMCGGPCGFCESLLCANLCCNCLGGC